MHKHFTRRQIDTVKKTLSYMAYPFIFIAFGLAVIVAVLIGSFKWIVKSFNHLKNTKS